MRCDVSAGLRLRISAVGAGDVAFLDWVAPGLVFLRTATTKVDSKMRSLEEPVGTDPLQRCRTSLQRRQ